MSVIVVGLNHRTAPVEMRERVAVPSSRLDKALHDLSSREHLAEVVLLSTCNRIEIYARSTKFHSAVSDILDFLAEQGGAPPEDVLRAPLHVLRRQRRRAISSGSTAGLDSMIIGEGEILGQVRGAWQLAGDGGRVRAGCSPGCSAMRSRSASASAPRPRSAGRPCRSRRPPSRSPSARCSRCAAARCWSSARATSPRDSDARSLPPAPATSSVANRTYARAVDLAEKLGGRAVSLGELPEILAPVDVLLTATDSTEVHVERADVEAVMERRNGAPLLIVDVAVPRDVDPGAGRGAGRDAARHRRPARAHRSRARRAPA